MKSLKNQCLSINAFAPTRPNIFSHPLAARPVNHPRHFLLGFSPKFPNFAGGLEDTSGRTFFTSYLNVCHGCLTPGICGHQETEIIHFSFLWQAHSPCSQYVALSPRRLIIFLRRRSMSRPKKLKARKFKRRSMVRETTLSVPPGSYSNFFKRRIFASIRNMVM